MTAAGQGAVIPDKQEGLLWFFGGVEEFAIFFYGKAIRHPRNVIANCAFKTTGIYPFLHMLWQDGGFFQGGVLVNFATTDE